MLSLSLGYPIIPEEGPGGHLSEGHDGSIFGGLELDHEDYEEYDYQENSSEAPLPAGPTRPPVPPSPLPLTNNIVDNPSFSKLASLPLLTTKPPPVLHSTTRRPRTHFGQMANKEGKVGSLLVHSSMDVVDQTRLFAKMDPFQEQFINPPRVNAGNITCPIFQIYSSNINFS